MRKYSDVTHEVKPVTSGHRVVLTYNVINDSKSQLMEMPTASTLGDTDNQLRQVLKLWGAEGAYDYEGQSFDFVCHQLSHQYTKSSLSLSRLVGDDLKTVNKIASIAKETGFLVYLSIVERKLEGGCDEEDPRHEIIDEIDSHWKLKKIVNVEDQKIGQNVMIKQSNMVDFENFDHPDKRDYSGWTGNEGTSTTLNDLCVFSIIATEASIRAADSFLGGDPYARE